MHFSDQGILVILLVGLVAGWLAGKIVRGAGFGIIGDIVIGIVGAFIASWLLPRLHIALGSGLIREIINATLGAVVLLLVVRLLTGGRRRW
ncbi:MAG TPA: GlsB/YeaQ/YmgE family stress response membrane protein [Pseudolabrys sp.]|nr:GlsB/YeaQ/YmgE family stress response membrane protein [Pseudolabrys sp.]